MASIPWPKAAIRDGVAVRRDGVDVSVNVRAPAWTLWVSGGAVGPSKFISCGENVFQDGSERTYAFMSAVGSGRAEGAEPPPPHAAASRVTKVRTRAGNVGRILGIVLVS
jgi:hypothetical protein